jgi:hypothetical protein
MTPAGPMFARQAAGSCVKGHSEGLALAASVTGEFTSYLFRPANFVRDMNRKIPVCETPLGRRLLTVTETRMPGDQRWIDLDGADNMRDLGGLEVTGGGRTRFDRLLRSGTLQDLTADDVSYLVKDMGVHTVLDLRLPDEAERELPFAAAFLGGPYPSRCGGGCSRDGYRGPLRCPPGGKLGEYRHGRARIR